MKNAKCPACSRTIQLNEKTKLHELINCRHCNSLLEFIADFPPTLDWAEEPAVLSTRRVMNKLY